MEAVAVSAGSQGGPISLPWAVIVHDFSVLTSLCCCLPGMSITRKCFFPHFHYFYLKWMFAVKDPWLFWCTV